MITELLMFIFFIFVSYQWFTSSLRFIHAKRHISYYIDICKFQLDSIDITENQADSLSLEIQSLQRVLNIVNNSEKQNIITILRDPLMTSKKGGKNK